MSFILLIFCALAAIMPARAQILDFQRSTWDFGSIEELGGTVSCKFEFKNNGENPLVIYNIRSSCGCTTTNYSTQPIMAGESSTIEVTYDPINRPGVFMRDIYIYSTASKEPTTIQITGTVIGRTQSVEERFPYIVNEVARVNATHISAGVILPGLASRAKVEMMNVSADTILVSLVAREPKEYLNVGFPQAIAPAKAEVMEVEYLLQDGMKMEVGEDGRVADTLDIFIDGRESGRWLRVSGIVSKQ